jgi:hypothetical protein
MFFVDFGFFFVVRFKTEKRKNKVCAKRTKKKMNIAYISFKKNPLNEEGGDRRKKNKNNNPERKQKENKRQPTVCFFFYPYPLQAKKKPKQTNKNKNVSPIRQFEPLRMPRGIDSPPKTPTRGIRGPCRPIPRVREPIQRKHVSALCVESGLQQRDHRPCGGCSSNPSGSGHYHCGRRCGCCRCYGGWGRCRRRRQFRAYDRRKRKSHLSRRVRSPKHRFVLLDLDVDRSNHSIVDSVLVDLALFTKKRLVQIPCLRSSFV